MIHNVLAPLGFEVTQSIRPRNAFPDQVRIVTDNEDDTNDLYAFTHEVVESRMGPQFANSKKFKTEIIFPLMLAVSGAFVRPILVAV